MVDSIFVILMFDVETNPSAIVSVHNTWSCLPYIYNNIRKHSSLPLLEREARCTKIKNRVYAQAADAIRITYGQVVGTKMPDGAFGYNRNGSTYAAQGCPIAVPGTREGDMNGNSIASICIVRYICQTLDLAEYEIPIFTERERVLFVSIIEELSPVEKKYPRPSSLPDLSKYQ
jgi:hypothetical protein